MKLHRPKKRLTRVLIALAMLLGLFGSAVFITPGIIMSGKRQTLDEAMEWQSEHYDTSFYEELEKQDYTVTILDGYELHAQLLKNPDPTDKYIIISHGYTDNRYGALKYVQMYLRLGFNCIIYDLRGHGENEKTFTTYSIREGQDITELVSDARSRFDGISVLGLHGESLGAASTAASLGYSPQVDFAVCDCGFSDIENVLKGGFEAAHLPSSFMYNIGDLGAKLRYGFRLSDMRPVDKLGNNKVPMLFIHGEDDELIDPSNSQRMADATAGYSEVHLIKGAVHAMSILTAPEEYEEYVRAFLQKIGI